MFQKQNKHCRNTLKTLLRPLVYQRVYLPKSGRHTLSYPSERFALSMLSDCPLPPYFLTFPIREMWSIECSSESRLNIIYIGYIDHVYDIFIIYNTVLSCLLLFFL